MKTFNLTDKTLHMNDGSVVFGWGGGVGSGSLRCMAFPNRHINQKAFCLESYGDECSAVPAAHDTLFPLLDVSHSMKATGMTDWLTG